MRTNQPDRTWIAPLALIAIVVLVLAACAGSASNVLAPVGNAVDGEGITGGGDNGAPAASAAPPVTDGQIGAVDDARIIRTGTIELEVLDVAAAVAIARDGIRGMGGYVGASQTTNQDDHPIASITYRIPADRWEDALDLLRGLNGQTSKVVTEQTESVEVTGQVIDLEARIANLRASETALQEIAAGAVRISDVLEVQAQLTSVRGQIEQLTAQLGDLEDRAAFATLTATFSVPIIAVTAVTQDWDARSIVDEASASLIEVLQGLATAGIWFAIVWLPILAVLGLAIGFVAFIIRRAGGIRPGGTRGTMPG
jgi:hypothetical protein